MKDILSDIISAIAASVVIVLMLVSVILLGRLGFDLYRAYDRHVFTQDQEVCNATVQTLILTSADQSYSYDFCILQSGTDNVFSIIKARVSKNLSQHIKPGYRVGWIRLDPVKPDYEVVEVYQGETIPAENANVVPLNQR